MKKTLECKKAILAGMLVGIGGISYLTVDSKILGSALFAVGLLSVILFSCSLYTGKVGYFAAPGDFLVLLKMCLLNFVGAAIIGFIASFFLDPETIGPIITAKLSQNIGVAFLKSMLCGVMIYISVELYKRTQQVLLVVMPIMIFILCGFEHCVANAFYFAAGLYFDLYSLLFFIVCILGNAAGSIIIHQMIKHEI